MERNNGGVGYLTVNEDYYNYNDALRYLQTCIDEASNTDHYNLHKYMLEISLYFQNIIIKTYLKNETNFKT